MLDADKKKILYLIKIFKNRNILMINNIFFSNNNNKVPND